MPWYMLLFQFPDIAEQWLAGDNWANFRAWARHPDTGQVIADLESAGSLTPGLNWHRANLPPQPWAGPPPQLPPARTHHGHLEHRRHGAHRMQMTGSADYLAGPWRYERLDGPGHWMQLDAPDQVNALLLDFLPR
jgi:pimeloyl-ACP methyl ester carboxylesterase